MEKSILTWIQNYILTTGHGNSDSHPDALVAGVSPDAGETPVKHSGLKQMQSEPFQWSSYRSRGRRR